MSDRPDFITRRYRLIGRAQVEAVRAMLMHVPVDVNKPLEVVIQEERKARSLDQNALMWAGPLREIAEQAWVSGQQFSAEVWHIHYKTKYLPEEFDEELCKEGYVKWDFTPTGDRVLVGSTTQLTKKGFGQYLEQVLADGAGMGVMFTTSPRMI